MNCISLFKSGHINLFFCFLYLFDFFGSQWYNKNNLRVHRLHGVVMKKEKYEAWLKEQGVDSSTQAGYKSRIQSLEEHQNINIDDEYDKDKCFSLLSLFQYSKDDVYNKRKPKHSIEMNSTTGKDIYDTYFEGTADYRSRIKKYMKFREETDNTPIINAHTNSDKAMRAERLIKTSEKVFKTPLNQILYGPPGTGKTYKTINAALEILSPEFVNITDRSKQKEEFDRLLDIGKIKFVTFHQSYSYEDFVEGLRPTIADDDDNKSGTITYAVKDGIFKEICEAAQARTIQSLPIQSVENKQIWKMSLGDSYKDRDTYTYCLKNNKILMGYGGNHDFSVQASREEIASRLEDEERTNGLITAMVYNFSQKMKKGDIVVVPEGLTKIRAIAEIVGDYEYFTQEDIANHQGYVYRQARNVRWLCHFDPSMPVSNLQEKQFSQLTLYSLALNEKEKENLKNLVSPQDEKKNENYVLIIDEINRGNISGIFGELITLIEPSKRLGAKEELKTILPYSRESFGVPDNLYIIGTMNTADRSLTGLDIALRRRFTFVEMPPQPQLLEDKYIEDSDISLRDVLTAMNERIEVLLGRDYCIGHAAFINLDDIVTINELKEAFQGTVIPLLQEYFFEDWNKIHLVLNDHKKDEEFRFIRKKELSSFLDDNEFSNLNREIWQINNEAFESIESYVGIVHPT